MTAPIHILSRLGVSEHDALGVVEALTHHYGPGGWTTSDFTDRLEDEGCVVGGDIRTSELRALERCARAEIGADMDGPEEDDGDDDE